MDTNKKVENKLGEIKNKVLLIKDFDAMEIEEINHLTQNISDKINVIEKKFNDELGNFKNSKITINFKELINNLLFKISSISLPNNLSDLYNTDQQLASIILEIDKVEILTILSSVENTIVFVGANGAGKSSFVSELKKTTLPNLCVLPAQKYLIFNKNAFRRDKSTIESYQQSMHENYIDIARNISDEHRINQYFSYTFTFLITSLIKEYSEIATRKMRNEEDYQDKTPIWEQLEEIWNQLIPNITFEIEPNEREVYANKKGNRYGLNGLSDGEKCIIFYIGNVLIAPKNSYIVVDEPETFLNPSIYNKLWDLLILKRQDCQFIFTSHTMDFINSRTNCRYIWCKNFKYPNEFDLKLLEKENDFPISLLTELIGSRKPILFCEGNYNSLDYQIFSKIFLEYNIKPVGGHQNVINYTKGYNKISEIYENRAIGIIDSDFMEDSEIEKYKNFKVFTLPFNEIEMLLLDENIINSVLKPFKSEEEINTIIRDFKDKFFEEANQNKERIILQSTKIQVDRIISTSLIQKYSTIEEIDLEVKNSSSKINAKKIYDHEKAKLEKILKDKDYIGLLKMCNLKKQIVRGCASNIIIENYENRAVERIGIDTNLSELLRKLYFNNMII